MPPSNFKQKLGKGGPGDFQGLLVLTTFPEKTTPALSGPSPFPKDQSQMVS